MFARGEVIRLCKEALAGGPKTTKELALHVIAAKGLDAGDKVLAHAIAQRRIHALRQKWRRGQLQDGYGGVDGYLNSATRMPPTPRMNPATRPHFP
jgi:hypothetical protein